MSASHETNQVEREIWMLYFNRVLRKKGVITEKEYNKMKVRILSGMGGGGL